MAKQPQTGRSLRSALVREESLVLIGIYVTNGNQSFCTNQDI